MTIFHADENEICAARDLLQAELGNFPGEKSQAIMINLQTPAHVVTVTQRGQSAPLGCGVDIERRKYLQRRNYS